MNFKAMATDDLARLTALDEHDEAVLFRPAEAGAGTACRAVIERGGEANVAAGLNVYLYTALILRAALVAITGGREAQPGDRLTCSDAGTATGGEWLVVSALPDIGGGMALGLVPWAQDTTGRAVVAALTMDHLIPGLAGESQEAEADAVVGGSPAAGDQVVLTGDLAGTWAVTGITQRDGTLARCRLRRMARRRSGDPAARRSPA